jgi:transcription-repair coupling factor (superfamily II helicase)
VTRLHSLKQLLRQTPEYQAVLRRAVAARPDGAAPISLGAIEAARAVVAAALTEDLSGNGLLLANSDERARQFLEELAFWFEGELLLFPAPEALPLERIPWSQETIRERVRVLASLVRQPSQRRIVVASVQSLLTPLPAPEQLRGRLLMVRPGYQIALSDLTRYLVDNGYQQATVVEVPGTFSRRGGIVDVFPATASSPVRVEFFGDLVDSLRSFDPESQLSTGMVDHVLLSPATRQWPGLGLGAWPPWRAWIWRAATPLLGPILSVTERCWSRGSCLRHLGCIWATCMSGLARC